MFSLSLVHPCWLSPPVFFFFFHTKPPTYHLKLDSLDLGGQSFGDIDSSTPCCFNTICLYCLLIASQTRNTFYILGADIYDYTTVKDVIKNTKHIYKHFFQYAENVRLSVVQIPALHPWKRIKKQGVFSKTVPRNINSKPSLSVSGFDGCLWILKRIMVDALLE